MSSSLFVMAMDVLSEQLDAATRSGQFTPHPKCNEPLITHLSFADDVLIFVDGTSQSLEAILEILDRFYHSIGLELSLSKSRIFLDGNNQALSSSLASLFVLHLVLCRYGALASLCFLIKCDQNIINHY